MLNFNAKNTKSVFNNKIIWKQQNPTTKRGVCIKHIKVNLFFD